MRVRTAFWLLVVALLVLNFADFATTWLGVTSGKGVEANSFWQMFGGPLSPFAIFLKLLIMPGLIVSLAWLVTRRTRDIRSGLVAIVPAATVFAGAAVNNVIIVTKKVRKVAGRNPSSLEEVTKT